MTDATRRLIQNLPPVLQGFSIEQLYQLAVGLRHELARRGLDCAPEADALGAALLVAARAEHAAIFSADCTEQPGHVCPWGHVGADARRYGCAPAENS